jgi:hypothetical protein
MRELKKDRVRVTDGPASGGGAFSGDLKLRQVVHDGSALLLICTHRPRRSPIQASTFIRFRSGPIPE